MINELQQRPRPQEGFDSLTWFPLYLIYPYSVVYAALNDNHLDCIYSNSQ